MNLLTDELMFGTSFMVRARLLIHITWDEGSLDFVRVHVLPNGPMLKYNKLQVIGRAPG